MYYTHLTRWRASQRNRANWEGVKNDVIDSFLGKVLKSKTILIDDFPYFFNSLVD